MTEENFVRKYIRFDNSGQKSCVLDIVLVAHWPAHRQHQATATPPLKLAARRLFAAVLSLSCQCTLFYRRVVLQSDIRRSDQVSAHPQRKHSVPVDKFAHQNITTQNTSKSSLKTAVISMANHCRISNGTKVNDIGVK